MKRWWVRWYGSGVGFEYHGPWWQSGEAFGSKPDGTEVSSPIFVAAVLAESEGAARAVIEACYHKLVKLEWSFTNERTDDWEPFCDRFPRAGWMKWPPPPTPEGTPPR